jgi:hypothetical protein
MPSPSKKPLPTDPPPGVPVDQTQAPIYFDGGAVQKDFARLWRKVRGLFSARNPQK